MRILVLTPFAAAGATGNSVAARRLAAGFAARAAEAQVLGAPEVEHEAAVAAAVRSFDPDAVLALHAYRCAPAIAACRRASPAPIAVSLRGTDLNEMLDDPARLPVIEGSLDQAAGIVVWNEPARERLLRHRPDWAAKTAVIPNGAFLPPARGDLRARFGIGRAAPVFVAIAGLREVKRPLLVLPWLEALRADVPGLHWLHAGAAIEPAIAAELRRWQARADWVHHVDHVPHEQIGDFLATGTLFVAASRSEGMPHAVREAMLAGLPLLLSDIPGHRALARDGDEALFFTGEAAFRAAAHWLLGQPEAARAMGAAARSRAERELVDADEVGAYLRFLQSLAGRDPSARPRGRS